VSPRPRGHSRSSRTPAAPEIVAAIETTVVAARAKPALAVRGPRTTHDASRFVIVRVVTESGAAGYGEVSATAAWSGEDDVTATHYVREVFAPLLRGRPLEPVAAHAKEMDRVVRGNAFTKAGIETALWDALGRAHGVRVTELLGGPFRDRVPVKISLSGDGEALRAAYETATSLGFSSFKVKVGRDPDADLARVGLTHELAGGQASLGVDANGGWSRETALATIPQLRELGVEFVEQPVDGDDLEGLAAARRFGVPVVADESVYTARDVERLSRAGAADVASVYVGKSSGLERGVAAAALAAKHGLGVVIGSNGEMGLGAAAQIHLACACEHLGAIAHGVIGQHFYEEEPALAQTIDIDGVTARLPEGPGLGVTLRDEVVRTFSA
jgi:L-alanine-DL-glutamate epimerase-like enolase superfamily enzyme